jgi:hypothetical protein
MAPLIPARDYHKLYGHSKIILGLLFTARLDDYICVGPMRLFINNCVSRKYCGKKFKTGYQRNYNLWSPNVHGRVNESPPQLV